MIIRITLVLALLVAATARGQTKGATALLNLVAAPSAPSLMSLPSVPAASMAALPAYNDRVRVSMVWNPPAETVDGYRLLWSYSTNASGFTNSATTTRTNATVAVQEGGSYWFKCRSILNGAESPDSNVVPFAAPFYGELSHYIFVYRTRGKSGATNRVQEATSPTGPWVTTKTFIGTGSLTNVLCTNNATAKFFRTVTQ